MYFFLAAYFKGNFHRIGDDRNRHVRNHFRHIPSRGTRIENDAVPLLNMGDSFLRNAVLIVRMSRLPLHKRNFRLRFLYAHRAAMAAHELAIGL
ncbi:hypothetical protein D3C85_1267700 [compost metagenome]